MDEATTKWIDDNSLKFLLENKEFIDGKLSVENLELMDETDVIAVGESWEMSDNQLKQFKAALTQFNS